MPRYGFDENVGAIDLKQLYSKDIDIDNISSRVMEMGKTYEKQAEDELSKNYELVERLAKALSEKEIMTGSEIENLLSA